jgi:predicted GH43/DUF377 family glycosyl hydrolase
MKIQEKLLLTPKNFRPSLKKLVIDGIFNPAAIRLPNKKIMLYVRVAESSPLEHGNLTCPIFTEKGKIKKIIIPGTEKMRKKGNLVYLKTKFCGLLNISHFRRVTLDKTGFNIEKIEQKPIFTGLANDGDLGVEDPRIVEIGGKYLMTYVSVSSKEGVSTSLAISKNLGKWERKGIIFPEQNKDVVLFPEKIKGEYVALHRPEGFFIFSRPSIWISHSKDLIYWGKEKTVICPRPNSWDSRKVGTGPPPIKTKDGWLLIYHGVRGTGKRMVYSAGAVLIDLKNPEKIIARTPVNKPLIYPHEKYETTGFMNKVIFPTGLVGDLDKKNILLYVGGADKGVSVKKIAVQDILESLEYYD